MSNNHVFEIHELDGKVWVRPYLGCMEYSGETFENDADMSSALPGMADELGWTE